MRLREISEIMNENIGPIRDILKSKQEINNNYYNVENYSKVLKAISNISKTGLIDLDMKQLEKDDLLLLSGSGKVRFSPDRFAKLSLSLNSILIKILTIDELVGQSYDSFEERPESLIVSFPDRPLSLPELSEIVNNLSKTFKLLNDFEPFNNDEIKVQDFDIGSNWLIILFGTSLAVKIFGQIVFTAQRIQINGLSKRFLEKQLENIEMEEKDKNAFIKQAREISLNTYRPLAEKIITDNDLESTDELITQMGRILEQVQSLNEQGVGFKSGINSSIDVANSFPSIEQQKSSDVLSQLSSLKQIPEHNKDNTK